MASHFADQRRVDEKKTTLTLLPGTLRYFFSTVLRKGELTKEGQEELSERYHLETEQFEKIRAPVSTTPPCSGWVTKSSKTPEGGDW